MDTKYKKIYLISLIIIIFDQFIKIFIENNLNNDIVVIKNFFNITLAHNTGGAFSILNNNTLLLSIIGIITIVLICHYIKISNNINKYYVIIYSLLCGGVIGNLIDRIVYGYVIDYLSFKFGSYYFPIFNLADICICISALLIIIDVLKVETCKKLK